MTADEFDDSPWFNGMTCTYRGERRAIVSCDFQERLIGLRGMGDEDDDVIDMVRCESVSDVIYPVVVTMSDKTTEQPAAAPLVGPELLICSEHKASSPDDWICQCPIEVAACDVSSGD